MKPTGGPEHRSDESQCQGCFPLGCARRRLRRARGQVKQGSPQSGLHWLQVLPGCGIGLLGQTFAPCHQEAVHLCGCKAPAEKPAPLFPEKLPGLHFLESIER